MLQRKYCHHSRHAPVTSKTTNGNIIFIVREMYQTDEDGNFHVPTVCAIEGYSFVKISLLGQRPTDQAYSMLAT